MSDTASPVTTPFTGRLLEPIQLGDIKLSNRIVLAPLTRLRNDQNTCVPHPLAAEYYSQRGSTPGTLLITEGTIVTPQAHGMVGLPGIWSREQVAGWKKVVDAVHNKGSYLFMQLFTLGFAAVPEVLARHGSFDYVSASHVPLSTQKHVTPRPLTVSEIDQYVEDYAKAAVNYMSGAGGDGVEIHGANGYLLDQFLHTNTNKRTDEYGGSAENRARFMLRVVDAVVNAVGERKVALRLSPWSRFQDMRMPDKDLEETFAYVVREVKARHPNFAYIHVIEPRIDGPEHTQSSGDSGKESSQFLRDIWSPSPYIAAGGFLPLSAADLTANSSNVLVAFGRRFISNPDLVSRIAKGRALSPYNRQTFYYGGAEGYIDYPFYE